MSVSTRPADRSQGERRRHARVPMSFFVQLDLDDSRIFRRAANLSLGGIGFDHPLFLKMGTRMAMTLLIEGMRLAVEGEVLEGEPSEEKGRVRFLSPTPETHLQLTKYLSARQARQTAATGVSAVTASCLPEGVLILRGEAGGIFSLGWESKVIGSDATQADILVPHATVSRRHAVVRACYGRHVIEDLGSTNGLYHEGRSVVRLDLRHGLNFHIGGVEAEYLDASQPVNLV